MKRPKYQLKSTRDFTIFKFTSIGKNGIIEKIIHFEETQIEGVFNLGFGDLLPNDDYDDYIVTSNGDTEKVLATVASAVFLFTKNNKNIWIYAKGSTPARTRLYRMGINKYYDEISAHFEIYGLLNEEWLIFDKQSNYEAFLVKRK